MCHTQLITLNHKFALFCWKPSTNLASNHSALCIAAWLSVLSTWIICRGQGLHLQSYTHNHGFVLADTEALILYIKHDFCPVYDLLLDRKTQLHSHSQFAWVANMSNWWACCGCTSSILSWHVTQTIVTYNLLAEINLSSAHANQFPWSAPALHLLGVAIF